MDWVAGIRGIRTDDEKEAIDYRFEESRDKLCDQIYGLFHQYGLSDIADIAQKKIDKTGISLEISIIGLDVPKKSKVSGEQLVLPDACHGFGLYVSEQAYCSTCACQQECLEAFDAYYKGIVDRDM